jgi:hypothetical protein
MKTYIINITVLFSIWLISCDDEQQRINPYDKYSDNYIDIKKNVKTTLLINNDIPYINVDTKEILVGSNSSLSQTYKKYEAIGGINGWVTAETTIKYTPNSSSTDINAYSLLTSSGYATVPCITLSNGDKIWDGTNISIPDSLFKIIDNITVLGYDSFLVSFNTKRVNWLHTNVYINANFQSQELELNTKGVKLLYNCPDTIIKASLGTITVLPFGVSVEEEKYSVGRFFKFDLVKNSATKPEIKITYDPSKLPKSGIVYFALRKYVVSGNTTFEYDVYNSKVYIYNDLKNSNYLIFKDITLEPGCNYYFKYSAKSNFITNITIGDFKTLTN